ncbi:MAG: ABC transporter ATP-binding protein [Halobacteriota archaeon]
MTILEGKQLRKTYGGLVAVDDIDIAVEEGEIRGLIGPNGAGKSTLLNLITRVEEPDSGEVWLDGEEITDWTIQEVTRGGLAKTNQTAKPLQDMTVLENVAVAAVFGGNRDLSMDEGKEVAHEWLEFVGIDDIAHWPGEKLTHTTARKLEVARTLATEPKVLMLDEAAAGLNKSELQEFMEMVEHIRDELGITILWIEHVMEAIMNVADSVTAIHFGEKIAEGTPQDVIENSAVQEAYLGGDTNGDA